MRLFLFLSLLVSVCCYSQEKSYDAVWGLLRKGNLQEAQMKLNEMDDRSDPVYLTILGEIHSRKGRINQAIGAFGRALLRFEELEQIQTENYAIALNDLGLAFWNAGNESKALEYLLRARDIRLINFGQDDEQLAGSYNDIGLVYSTSQPRKALNNYEKALEIYRTIYGDNHEKIAQALVNIGIIQLKTGIYGAAIGNFEDALSIWQEIYGRNQHPNEAFVHVNLAQTYAGFGDRETSLRELDKAISIYINTYGNEHPDLASTYNILGSFRLQQDDHEGALNAYQKAIQANVPGFDKSDYYINPSTSNYYNGNVLLNSLLYKAQALETKHFRETLKFSELEGALASLLKCDTLIDKLRQTRTSESDKIALGKIAAQVYEAGVRIAFSMGELAFRHKSCYYEQAFYFSEKSKSAVLLEAISETNAKTFANISSDLLDLEDNLKGEIAFYEQKLAGKPSDSLERIFRKRLFDLNREYIEFISNLEQRYPEYYKLKYNVLAPSIENIQQTLAANSAMVSYFLEDQHQRIYIFIITKNKFKSYNRPQTDRFDQYLSGLRNGIYYRDLPTYKLTAENLYEIVYPGNLPGSVDHLVVVPAGRLGVVPFEALLTKKTKFSDASKLPFLLNDYSISYAYSSTLYIQAKQAENRVGKNNAIFLCAPIDFTRDDLYLPGLPGTQKEVDQIAQLFRRKKILSARHLREEANEARVKSEKLKDFSYLHFATHGVVDEYSPELSRIYLANDQTEDGSLYTGEIFNLDLNASLVTLSACQTGLGKISKGEGIIGLSRALLYAGADNIMVSLWSVADESTSQLMIDFYDNLLSDSSINYSRCLQKAKLAMLTDERYADPYYWAPFILIGR